MADQADQGFNPRPPQQPVPQQTAQPKNAPEAVEASPLHQPPPSASDGTGMTDASEALEKVAEAAEKVASTTDEQVDAADTFQMPHFEDSDASTSRVNGTASSGLERLDDVELDVQIELGRTRMYVQDVLRLNSDSVIELERAAGDPVDIRVNGQLVARGEVLVVDETLCVRIGEIVEENQGAN